MKAAKVSELKASLSKYVARVKNGEEILVTERGRPVAKLVPWTPESPRILGLFAGQIQIEDDFDDLPEDIQSAFEGESS